MTELPIDHGHEPHAGYCTHCGGRLRSSTVGFVTTRRNQFDADCSTRYNFHGDRRTCRVAAHGLRSRWTPPEHPGEMDVSNYGAALIGFDFVRWPWWLRWVPDTWLAGLRNEVALKVGGSVERAQAARRTTAAKDSAPQIRSWPPAGSPASRPPR